MATVPSRQQNGSSWSLCSSKVFSVAGTLVSPAHELFANDDDDQEDSKRDVLFERLEQADDEAYKPVICRGGRT